MLTKINCAFCRNPFEYKRKHAYEKRKYCCHECSLDAQKYLPLTRNEYRRILRNSKKPLRGQLESMHRILRHAFYRDTEENFNLQAFQKNELEREFPRASVKKFIELINHLADKQATNLNSKKHAQQKQTQKATQTG